MVVSDGPFEAEEELRTLPAVRRIYEAMRASRRRGVMRDESHRLLCKTLAACGVELGAEDHKYVLWQSQWTPESAQAVADWAKRAFEAGQQSRVMHAPAAVRKTVPTTEDMRARWLPDDQAVLDAIAKMAAEPRADVAMIGMIQPGKQRGVWTLGQEVETVPGALYIGISDLDVPPGSPVRSFAIARNLACAKAREALGDRSGTVAYAVVERDGYIAVFEDY